MAVTCFLKLLAKFAVLAPLLKSSIDIILVNEDTPKLIVERSQYLIQQLNRLVFVEQDSILRQIMKHQKEISLTYAFIVLTICMSVLVGMRCMINTLIALILASIVFFHMDFEMSMSKPVNMESVKTISLLMIIVGALFMMKGLNTKAVYNPEIQLAKDQQKAQAAAKQAQQDEIQQQKLKQQEKQQKNKQVSGGAQKQKKK
eukprot:403355139